MLSKELKSSIIEKSRKEANDTGSTDVQIALLSARIEQIAAHLKKFPKDKHSHAGLMKIIGRRRSLQKYADRTSRS